MRVLHMDTGREMRGGQYQILFLMRALRERGVEQALSARRGSPLEQRAAEEGFALAKTSRTGFDLFHAHDARSHTEAALRNMRPLVVSRRVAFPVKRGLLSRWKYSRPDRFIAVSNHVAARLREAGVEESRIRVVYDAAPAMPLASGDAVIAPATKDPRKGSALASDAARLANIKLSFSSNLAEDLLQARLLIYLSDEEGLGSAALLAQSAGVPVLASRVGGLSEAIEDGVTGRLTTNQPELVANAIREMLASDPTAMSTAARARWLAHFTIEGMAGATLDIYRELIP